MSPKRPLRFHENTSGSERAGVSSTSSRRQIASSPTPVGTRRSTRLNWNDDNVLLYGLLPERSGKRGDVFCTHYGNWQASLYPKTSEQGVSVTNARFINKLLKCLIQRILNADVNDSVGDLRHEVERALSSSSSSSSSSGIPFALSARGADRSSTPNVDTPARRGAASTRRGSSYSRRRGLPFNLMS